MLDYKAVPLLKYCIVIRLEYVCEYITWAHCSIIKGWQVVGLRELGSGVAPELLVTCLQGFEY